MTPKMSLRPLSLFLFCAFLVLGCGVATSFTRTGQKLPSRAETCTFEMLTAQPSGNYIELGTLDLTSGATSNLGEFRSAIRPQVCKAGGDAAFAFINGYGYYIKAVVLKRVDGPPPGAVSVGAMPAAPGGLPPAQPPAAGGCSYDTQCKGDRVCVQGACMDPKK